jgi:hypothetical protein
MLLTQHGIKCSISHSIPTNSPLVDALLRKLGSESYLLKAYKTDIDIETERVIAAKEQRKEKLRKK